MDAPKKNKQIQDAPEKKGAEKTAFMFPSNSQHAEAITVYAFTQEEAVEQYQK